MSLARSLFLSLNALAVSVLVGGGLAETASASTLDLVEVRGELTLSYQASPGVKDSVYVKSTQRGASGQDQDTLLINLRPETALGDGAKSLCTLNRRELFCPAAGVKQIVVDTGDMDDTVFIEVCQADTLLLDDLSQAPLCSASSMPTRITVTLGAGNDRGSISGFWGPGYAEHMRQPPAFVYGQSGNDKLYGCSGVNNFFGGSGADRFFLVRNGKRDVVDGGLGRDELQFGAEYTPSGKIRESVKNLEKTVDANGQMVCTSDYCKRKAAREKREAAR